MFTTAAGDVWAVVRDRWQTNNNLFLGGAGTPRARTRSPRGERECAATQLDTEDPAMAVDEGRRGRVRQRKEEDEEIGGTVGSIEGFAFAGAAFTVFFFGGGSAAMSAFVVTEWISLATG